VRQAKKAEKQGIEACCLDVKRQVPYNVCPLVNEVNKVQDANTVSVQVRNLNKLVAPNPLRCRGTQNGIYIQQVLR
jgi:hypothetical protein